MKKAIFLDRDGVINRKAPEGDYIIRWEDFEFLPTVIEAVGEINRAEFSAIVITNQRCVAKGLITADQLEALHQRMSDLLAERGARIDSIYYCPHETEPVCRCRKPAPGMFLDAARDHGIDLTASWMIGDSDLDIEAGKNAGCKTALVAGVDSGVGSDGRLRSLEADLTADSLFEAVRSILEYEKQKKQSEVPLPVTANMRLGMSS